MPDSDGAYCYSHPRPALTADAVVLRTRESSVQTQRREVLLIQRGRPPFVGHWALPGGFVNQGEFPKEAARRELYEETGLLAEALTQVGAFGDPGRDPRGWVVSIAYIVKPREAGYEAIAGDDAADAQWWPVDQLPPLAFDHAEIVAAALRIAVSS